MSAVAPCSGHRPSRWARRRSRGAHVPARTSDGPYGLDPLLRRKAERWFDCLCATRDTPGAPRLTWTDYELAALRTVRAFRHRVGGRAHRRLRAAFRRLWRRHDRAGSGTLDRAAFLAAHARALERDRRALTAAVHALCCALADAADRDGDDVLGERELRALLTAAFRLTSEHDLRTAWHSLDRDGGGAVEHRELHRAFAEFLTAADPAAPGNQLLGGLRPPRPGR